MNKFLIILFFSNSLFLISQTSGFMGKRLVIGYGFNTSPALFGATKNNETLLGTNFLGSVGTAENSSLAFNSLHEINIELVISSKWMICTDVKKYITGFDNSVKLDDNNYRSTINYNGNIKGNYTIKGINFGIYAKYFGSRNVAPWGRYMFFGPVVNFSQSSYDPKIMYIKAKINRNYYNGSYSVIQTKDTTFSDFGPKNQNFTRFDIMLGWGRSRIISKKVVIDFGATMQAISLGTILFDIVSPTRGAYTSRSNYIEMTEKSRVRSFNRFNVFLKIGYLF